MWCVRFAARDRKQAVLFVVGYVIVHVCSYNSALLRTSTVVCSVLEGTLLIGRVVLNGDLDRVRKK